MKKLKRIYALTDVKYPWILLISMSVFVMSLCIQHYHGDIDTSAETAMYGVGFAVALVWSILNYMSHLKLGALYKKYDDINAFVESMTITKEEKAELTQYLNDFVADMEEKGETYENAVKKAISHFQVQEFMEASGGEVFVKPAHYYLIGYISVFLGLSLIILLLYYFTSAPFILAAMNFTFVLYSVGFLGLFFLYKFIDTLISKK